MTLDEFRPVFVTLALQLRSKDADALTVKSYFQALADLDPAIVAQAADRFAREAGRKWFPTTGEWREAAELARTAALREAIPSRRLPWTHECSECEDTGWVLGLECDGTLEGQTCGRARLHAAHSFTKACLCRPTNRTWRRHQMVGAGE